MAYQVLARKYRPEKFQEVIGQDHVTQTLLNAFAQDRIAHAYLFAGPRGTGKTTTARILAKALNCLKKSDGNPCDECQNCTEIATSRSMDVLEIDGASNRGIDEIRNLRDLVRYPPIHAKFKIFIIDEVHMLTPQAFNALLKTLEEPPEHVKFVFATTEPNKVLPTILSRCQRHDFHRLSVDEILQGMRTAMKQEEISIDEKTEQTVARMADGSMRDALSLLDQIIAFCGDRIEFEQASSLLGIVPSSVFFEVTDAIKEKNHKRLLALTHSVHSEGYSLNDFVSGLNQHFLNFLVCKAESGRELLDATEDVLERYENECNQWEAKDLLRYSDLVTQMETNLKIVRQPRIYVETMMLKLLEMDSTVTVSDLISILSQRISPGTSPGTVQPQREMFGKSESPRPSSSGKVDAEKKSDQPVDKNRSEPEKNPEDVSQGTLLETIKDRWEDVISKVSESGASLSTFMSHGVPTELKGKRLVVSFPPNYKFHIDVLKKNAPGIESVIEKTFDQRLKIDFVASKDMPESRDAVEEETHPVTKRMLELFGGEIVE